MKWNNGTLQTPELRIQITNNHVHAPGEWVIHVREFGWNTKMLGLPAHVMEDIAQDRAIEIVKSHINNMLESISNVG